MAMRIGFGDVVRLGLALGLAFLVSACGAPMDDDFDDTDATDEETTDSAQQAMPKQMSTAGGKCHVKFGGFILVGSGTYSSSGECCGMTKCTNDCDGKKYVEVCILCNADADVKCEDGHHPVARVRGDTLRSTFNAVLR